VFLKNSDDAKRARDELDRKHVGNRYVEVLFANQKHWEIDTKTQGKFYEWLTINIKHHIDIVIIM